MDSTKLGAYAIILSVFGIIMAGTALSLPWYEVKTLTGQGGAVTEIDTYYVQYSVKGDIYDNAPIGPENSIELLLWTWLLVGLIFVGSILLNERPLGIITGIVGAAIGGASVFIFAPLFAHYYLVPGFMFEGSTTYGAYVVAGPTIGWWWTIAGFAFQVCAVVLRVASIMMSDRE